MVKGVRRRLVDLGNVDAPEGPLKIQLMIFNKEHIPLIIEQLKEEGFKPRTDAGSQYVKVDVPPPTRLQLMDVASDVDRRTKSCIGKINKIRSNTAIRITKAVENEFIDQRTAGVANKKIEKNFSKFEVDAIKAGMIKKMDILGKWFSPENDQEKDLLAKIKKKEKSKEENSD
ncbi:MAG: hypothetical protein CM15mP124_2270 [Alphaproteobacteria bacterium]|nr:MAG: hypothetical protein CM15mP124_2270 [Alphaproteobacteria bacterium]